MLKTTQNLFISIVTMLLLAGAINRQAIASCSHGGHGKKEFEVSQSLISFPSNQSNIQQAPEDSNQFKKLRARETKTTESA